MIFKYISKLIFIIYLFQSFAFGQQLKFTDIKLPDEIKSINELMVSKGILYIATAQGLYTYSDSTFNRFYENNNEEAFLINALCPDRNGNLWFGTYNGLLVKFSGKKISKIFDIKPHCKSDNYLVNSISIDTTITNKNSEILLSTSGGELFGFDTITQTFRKIINPGIGTIFSFQYGILPVKWLCTTDGLFSMSKNMKWKKNQAYFTVYKIAENKGKYWAIGRDNNKKAMFMLYYDEDGDNTKFSWKEFNLNQLNDKYLKFNELAFTVGEIAWIVTENGLVNYNPTNASLKIFDKVEGVDLKSLRHIAIAENSIIWISSAGRRLIKVEIE